MAPDIVVPDVPPHRKFATLLQQMRAYFESRLLHGNNSMLHSSETSAETRLRRRR
jgi:hypothetical protein